MHSKLEDFDHVRNSTIVGTWDLSSPSTKEAASIRVRTVDRRSLETLGPDGDHRTKVPDITGPKEYRGMRNFCYSASFISTQVLSML